MFALLFTVSMHYLFDAALRLAGAAVETGGPLQAITNINNHAGEHAEG